MIIAGSMIGFFSGIFGPSNWNWIKITILLVSGAALFIVSTVPDHFLEEHLWKHVTIKHVPRIFLWTFGTLSVMYILTKQMNIENTIQGNVWIVLLIACLVGLIPESGPHLVFVTLYAQGTIPFSILLASSIVQDGHGMLPLLADSRKAFIGIKTINFLAGIVCGLCGIAMGL